MKDHQISITTKKIAFQSNEGYDATITLSLPQGSTVDDALTKLNLTASKSYATLLNDKPIPAKCRGKTPLKCSDILTIFPPLKGG